MKVKLELLERSLRHMNYNIEINHDFFYIFYLVLTALYDKMTVVSEANETLSFMEPINEDKVT